MNKETLFNKSIIIIFAFVLVFSSYNIIISHYTYAYFSDSETISATFLASSDPSDYCPPYQPKLVNPSNGETRVLNNVLLQIYVEDPNNDSMNVSFFNNETKNCFYTKENVKSGSVVSTKWNNLTFGTTYYWYAIVEDWEDSITSKTWNFTTDHKPQINQLILPENNTINTNLSPILKINVSDKDDEYVNVTFYDDQHNIIKECKHIQQTAITTWKNLVYQTTYSWFAIADDGLTKTKSPHFSFTTKPQLTNPGSASNPSPSNPNNSPSAKTNGPYSANHSELIFFNASSSNDIDGYIQSYHWDFGDGTTATNQTIKKAYDNPGNYTVSLTVTDNKGEKDTIKSIASIHGLTFNWIRSTPKLQHQNETLNITCKINHSHLINQVYLTLIYPNKTIETLSMNQVSKNHSIYYYNQKYTQLGTYNHTITATDTRNTSTTSTIHSYSIYKPAPPNITQITVSPSTQQINKDVVFSSQINTCSTIQNTNITIITPTNTSHTKPLINESTRNSYSYVTTFNQTGNYTFYITAKNTDNLTTRTKNFTFTIVNDTNVPEISNITIYQSLKNQSNSVHIISTITDNFKIKSVTINITNPNNITETYTLINTSTSIYEFNKTFHIYGQYTFTITAIDTFNNKNTSPTTSFFITDQLPPVISNISINQINQTMNITVNITDNNKLKNVFINITSPDNSSINQSMQLKNESFYYYEDTFSPGNYSFRIYAKDLFENMQKSNKQTFST